MKTNTRACLRASVAYVTIAAFLAASAPSGPAWAGGTGELESLGKDLGALGEDAGKVGGKDLGNALKGVVPKDVPKDVSVPKLSGAPPDVVGDPRLLPDVPKSSPVLKGKPSKIVGKLPDRPLPKTPNIYDRVPDLNAGYIQPEAPLGEPKTYVNLPAEGPKYTELPPEKPPAKSPRARLPDRPINGDAGAGAPKPGEAGRVKVVKVAKLAEADPKVEPKVAKLSGKVKAVVGGAITVVVLGTAAGIATPFLIQYFDPSQPEDSGGS